ncbi:hypothetical protein Tco_0544615, partial [Tanacetum coccineum]
MSSNTSSKRGFMVLELKLTSNSKRGLEKVTESSRGTLKEDKSSHKGKTFLLSLLDVSSDSLGIGRISLVLKVL